MNAEEPDARRGSAGRSAGWTVSEVAGFYRVRRETVLQWLASGRLDGTRTPGGQWRIPDSALPPNGETAGPAPSANNPPYPYREDCLLTSSPAGRQGIPATHVREEASR